ncbi:hypothetical protein SAMN05892883_1739 [Jatrophihabitans sp. GAS493]|nr:hypothetical protein SAMN05892883_1739 [Jatrophihabitans sp. GAS493]
MAARSDHWGINVQSDIVVPAFEMDCRDWLVVTSEDLGHTEDLDGAPVLATLSTAVAAEDELHSISGVLMVGLLDDDVPPAIEVREGAVAAEMLDVDSDAGTSRFLLPCPDGKLALVAEFDLRADAGGRVRHRIEELMASFRWSA